MLTEQDKAIGRTVLREVERSSGHKLSALEVQLKQLQRQVEELKRELQGMRQRCDGLEQAVVKVANRG